MQFLISTAVEKSYDEVFMGFNEDLFQKLSPKNPPVTLLRFDGCAVGDEVHLEMTLPVIGRKELWVSRIIRAGEVKGNEQFADEFFWAKVFGINLR